MSFQARVPGQSAGYGVSIQYDEVLVKLAKRLPEDDSMVDQVRQLFVQSRDVIEAWMEDDELRHFQSDERRRWAALAFTIDDWIQGVRDWSEVERCLDEVRTIAHEIALEAKR